MSKYAVIQLDGNLHNLFKSFCKQNGYKMSGLVEKLIEERIALDSKNNTKVKKINKTIKIKSTNDSNKVLEQIKNIEHSLHRVDKLAYASYLTKSNSIDDKLFWLRKYGYIK